MAKHNETGLKGEQLAELFFSKKGYIIVARNWRSGHKEIDLIMHWGEWLVFAEIKTRRGLGFGFPEEAVTPAKQALMRTAAEAYLETHPEFDKVRFDVLSIVLNNRDEAIEMLHLEDAF